MQKADILAHAYVRSCGLVGSIQVLHAPEGRAGAAISQLLG